MATTKKTKRPPIPTHTSNKKTGSGDYQGTAIKQPIGTIRDNYSSEIFGSVKKGKKPRSLA